MYLKLLTNSNTFQYSQFIPEAFLKKKELLGVICLDEENNDDLRGVAVAEPEGEVLSVQWFYVLPEYRRTGAGSLMLQGLSEMAEAARLRAVDGYYHSEEAVDTFLLENGFVVMRENPIKSFTLQDIISSDYVAKHNKSKGTKELKAYEGISLEEITPEDEEQVISQLKAQGYPDYTPFCRRDISFICKKDGAVNGCMLLTDDPDESTITIMILLSFTKDPLVAAKLIIVAGDRVLKQFPPDYKASFVVANDNILKLVGTILDDTELVKTTGYTTHAVFEVNP